MEVQFRHLLIEVLWQEPEHPHCQRQWCKMICQPPLQQYQDDCRWPSYVLESLEHNCPQWCHAVLIGLVGVCSGPTQGLHVVPLIPKRRNGRTILFRSNTSASTFGRSKDLSNSDLLHIQSEREETSEHRGRLAEVVHDVDVPAVRGDAGGNETQVEVGLKPTRSPGA